VAAPLLDQDLRLPALAIRPVAVETELLRRMERNEATS
jgi:hypothetical protein